MPHEIIGGLWFVCTSPDKGGILIDDLKLLKGEPENITKAPEVCKDRLSKPYSIK